MSFHFWLIVSVGLRVVDEITTYFRTTSEYHYIPNLKDGIYKFGQADNCLENKKVPVPWLVHETGLCVERHFKSSRALTR
jgi:hypothetical protein